MNQITMKSFLAEPLQRNKAELWVATSLYFLVLFTLTTGSGHNMPDFREANVRFNYFEHYFWPQLVRYTLLYLAFLFMNFKVMPRLIRKEKVWLNVFLTLLTFVAVGLVIGILNTYTQAYLFVRFDSEQEVYDHLFQGSFYTAFWLLLMFGFYSAIKYIGLYLLSNSDAIQTKYHILTKDVLIAFIISMVNVFVLLALDAEEEITALCAVLSLYAILLYCLSFYTFIPKALQAKRPGRSYAWKVLLLVALTSFPIVLMLLPVFYDEDSAIGITAFNAVFQLVVVAPVIWSLYKRQAKGKEEVYVLRKELGRSNANLDFLRSQINPHFLFNALNTLYGTALQENSERTAQGIQKLGDMMRFMLHENHQQKILLSREIEYLQNYIELQLLRTSSSPNIVIETKIDEVLTEKYIAPMLLIPFVENAFKHGVSLQHRSWIKITLHCDENKLYFDVYNSKHTRSDQDPEKDRSGIGLSNVKQRLELLYPAKQELIIRETPDEFFVHLTLQL